MADKLYDLCIVGAGMIGSAAARHATLIPNMRVCLLGPDEPKDKNDNPSGIYGEWFDEGRLYRRSQNHPLLAAILSKRAIPRYGEIEKRSGIQFHTDVGCLTVGIKGTDFLSENLEAIAYSGVKAQELSEKALTKSFPYFYVSPTDVWLFEEENAGYINPRKLVNAEQTAAHLQGCDIIREVASHVTEVDQSSGHKLVQITTDGGRQIMARKVLVSTGAFTEARQLLPQGVRPHMQLAAHTILFAQVSKAEYEKMSTMPPLVYDSDCTRRAVSEEEQPGPHAIYMLPPILYPDGKYYLKIGNFQYLKFFKELDGSKPDQLADWFKGSGWAEEAVWLKRIIRLLLPDLQPESWHTGTCVISRTATHRPYVDLLTSNLGVAIGGNGYSAKLCDELGRLAINLLHKGVWEDLELSREDFRFVARPVCASKL